jgi:spermidine/putrescine transport system substrate-binding protein
VAEFGGSRRYSRRELLIKGLAVGGAGALMAVMPAMNAPAIADRTMADRAEANEPPKPQLDGDLNLFTWEGYFAASTIASFSKHYGVKVNQTYIASGTDQFEKVAAGLPFDCSITNSTQIPKLLPSGILRPIDKHYLKYGSQVITFFRNPPYDPGAKHSIGYAMAPFGLAWQSDRVSGLTGSWKDFWNLAPKYKGHGYMVDTEDAALGVSLMSLGYSENSGVASQVKQAAEHLIAIKPSLEGFASLNTIQILATGQAWLIPTYTGNVYTALLQAKNPKYLHFELCKEGQLFNADNMCIPTAAKHPGTAMLFITWMLNPKNMKANVDYIGYPVPTYAGLAAYDDLVKAYPFLKVGTDLIDKTSSWQQPLEGARETLWNQAWSEVQA